MRKIFCIIGILLCLIPMAGFGLCGLFGVTAGLNSIVGGSASDATVLLGCGVLGLAISMGLGFAIYAISKSFNSGSPRPPSPDE